MRIHKPHKFSICSIYFRTVSKYFLIIGKKYIQIYDSYVKMDILRKIFGKNSIHLRVILLFYNNNGYFNNITGLANTLNVSHVTARKVISDLVDAGILREIDIGKSLVIKVNESSPYAKALFDFISNIKSIKDSKSLEEIIEKRSKEAYRRMGGKI